MIALSFACGHQTRVSEDAQTAVCPQCGERRVSTVQARAPRFRGVCHGPSAITESLAGLPVSVGVPHAD